ESMRKGKAKVNTGIAFFANVYRVDLEDLSWTLIPLAVLIGIATDPAIKGIVVGTYRLGWWARRLGEKFLAACIAFWWGLRHVRHQGVAKSQNFGCMVVDWVKARTGHGPQQSPKP